MARVAGVDLPNAKRIEVALTYIFGIGDTLSKKILETTGISPDTRVKSLTDKDVNVLNKTLQEYEIEGDLRRKISMNIKRLMEINTYRGIRHKRKLPVRGQRTKTNARTRKGPRKTVGIMRKEVKVRMDKGQSPAAKPKG